MIKNNFVKDFELFIGFSFQLGLILIGGILVAESFFPGFFYTFVNVNVIYGILVILGIGQAYFTNRDVKKDLTTPRSSLIAVVVWAITSIFVVREGLALFFGSGNYLWWAWAGMALVGIVVLRWPRPDPSVEGIIQNAENK